MNYSADQIALQAHIQAENAQSAAAGFLAITDDLDHWAEWGITTVEQYEHHMVVGTYIDVYKDINGIKPRWMDFDSMTAEQVRAELNEMIERENRWEAELAAQQEEAAQRLTKELGVSREDLERWEVL